MKLFIILTINTIIIFLLIINNGYAFTFDIWKSGITIDNIFRIAKHNNLPLRRMGIAAINKKYVAKMCEPYRNSSYIFYYPYKILGENAEVILNITPKSKKLYMVSIEWRRQQTGYGSQFYKNLLYHINNKYECGTNRRKIFFKIKNFKIDNNNSVQIIGSSGQTKIIYTDHYLMNIAKKEINETRRKKQRNSFNNKINKF